MTGASLDAILSATGGRIAGPRSRAGELEHRAAAAPPPRSFTRALRGEGEGGGGGGAGAGAGAGQAPVGVIAEVKRRSPSAGAIREDLDPARHAASYQRGGAVAISVLTDETYFGGSLDDLARVVQAVSVPVLRKDFILDELQLLEARVAGASAVLLIVRALATRRLQALARTARDPGVGVLVEVHSEAELDEALAAEPTAGGGNSPGPATLAGGPRAAAG